MQAPSGTGWEYKKPQAKVRGVENLEEQWHVCSTLEVERGGKLLVQLNYSNHDFAIFQPDDPC